jgi:hypothetical protein
VLAISSSPWEDWDAEGSRRRRDRCPSGLRSPSCRRRWGTAAVPKRGDHATYWGEGVDERTHLFMRSTDLLSFLFLGVT